MIKIKCSTRFDITATGVIGHYRSGKHPYSDLVSWNRARNQQRNWESLTQLISLRTQVDFLSKPICKDQLWSFEFATETEIFNDGTDPVGVLKSDDAGIPMLHDLDNFPDIDPILVTSGPGQNIWFELISINNILEN